MKRLWKTLKRELKRKLTVMLIPHNTVKPLHISFSFSFLLSLIASWTLLTIWAGYIGSQHINYWKIKADNELMKLRMVFFAQQVRQSREMLDQVRENDEQMRALLQLKSKKAIIEEEEGKGGPTPEEIHDLTRQLSGRLYEMSKEDIERQTAVLQNETKKQLESYREILGYIEQQRVLNRATPNCWPCIGHVTSRFGFRIHPIFRNNDFHTGLDIANSEDTQVHSTAYGTVRLAEWQPGYGRLIIVDHGHGYLTYYGHLHKMLVKTGDKVMRGQAIGLMGDSGTSTGPHLHYEILYKNRAVNPARFLKKSLDEVTRSLYQTR